MQKSAQLLLVGEQVADWGREVYSHNSKINFPRVDCSPEELLESRGDDPEVAVVPVGYPQLCGKLQEVWIVS